MKHLKFIFLISLVVIILPSCETQQTNHDPQKAYLHLQGGWNNDDVRIDIDGIEVYHNDSVFTNNVLGLADIDSTIQPYGSHEIKVDVNNGDIHTENFDLHQTLWVGINLQYLDSSIHITYSTEPYMYE